jgi:hypothetical protein
MKKPKPKKISKQQNHTRLSLAGQDPDQMIEAFMKVPLKNILKRKEKKEKEKS